METVPTSISDMDSLNPEQAQALWDAGGFLILTDLPEGSEFGIDGTFHIVRKFSGIKFLPPGLHLITWSPPNSDSGPSTIPLRSSILKWVEPKERILMRYDPKTEGIEYVDGIITDDRLKGLDKELAAYPFEGLGVWRSLVTRVTEGILEKVMAERKEGRLDGMTGINGIEEEDVRLNTRSGKLETEGKLVFPVVDAKRSWRDGAVGEEVTKYSKDKSWLLGDVVKSEGDDLKDILGYLQLSFVLLLHLSSYSSLQIYQRLLALFTRSYSLLANTQNYIPKATSSSIRKTYTSLIHALSAQLGALPKNAFDMELPEMDLFYLEEIEQLRTGLANLVEGSVTEGEKLIQAWQALQKAAKGWGWDIDDLKSSSGQAVDANASDDEEEEEGEYAPQVVDI